MKPVDDVYEPRHSRAAEPPKTMPDEPLRTPTLLSVVAPVYDEELLVEEFVARATAAVADYDFELVLVNDGSKDRTPELLDKLAAADPRVRVIHLSRNFGHQAALTAGLEHAVGDVVAMIDADLQDPPELIPEMIAQWSQGSDVVYAVRKQREGETAFKLATASWFYKLFDKLAQVDLEPNSGDFRLLDRRALNALLAMTERSRFLRGMTVWIGFTQTAVSYQRDARHAGETKYTLRKMLRFSLDAIASFSHLPLQLATYVGILSAGVAFIAIPVVIMLRIADSYLPGFGSITIAILLLGGIQLIAIGVIGEYVGRIYDEVKHRPLYIVREELNHPSASGRADDRVPPACPRGLPRAHPNAEPLETQPLPRRGGACFTQRRWPVTSDIRAAPAAPSCLLGLLRAPDLRLGRRAAQRARKPVSARAAGRAPGASAAVIGQRAEGVLRFPEAVAVGPLGRHLRRRPARLRRAEVQPARRVRGQWGSFGGGHGQFGPIGGLADRRRRQRLRRRLQPRPDREVQLRRRLHLRLGPPRVSEPGQFNFGSSQDFTKPPGGGIAVSGAYVYVADSGNNRIQRFNLSGGEPTGLGDQGLGPGQFSYPRGVAANASEVLVSDDDNHRIEQFTPEGAYVAAVGGEGTGPGQFGFPYGVALDAAGDVFVADDINHRVVKLSPQLGLPRQLGRLRLANPGSSPSPARSPATPPATPMSPTRPTTASRSTTPNGNYLRTIGI